jgi:hypothetical protein
MNHFIIVAICSGALLMFASLLTEAVMKFSKLPDQYIKQNDIVFYYALGLSAISIVLFILTNGAK